MDEVARKRTLPRAFAVHAKDEQAKACEERVTKLTTLIPVGEVA
jgi:hypothetical protein